LAILARKTSPATAAALKKAGLNMEQLREIAAGPGGLVKALLTIVSALGDDQEALAAVFPNIRALSGVLGVAAAQSKQFAQIARSIGTDVDSLGEAFTRVTGEPLFQFQKALAELRVAAIRLGATVIPVATKMATAIGKFATKFSELPDIAQKAIGAIGLLVAVAGPALVMLGQLAIVTGTAGVALAAIAAPVTLAIAALGSIGVAVFQTIKHWDALVLRTKQAWAAIRFAVADAVADTLSSIAMLVRGLTTVSGVLSGIAGFEAFGLLSRGGDAVATALEGTAQSARTAANSVAGLIGAYERAFDTIESIRDIGERFGIPKETIDASIGHVRRLEDQLQRGEIEPSKFNQALVKLEQNFMRAGLALESEARGLVDRVNEAMGGAGAGAGAVGIDPERLRVFQAMQAQFQQLAVRARALGSEISVPEEQLEILGTAIDAFIEKGARMDTQLHASGVTLSDLATAYSKLRGTIDGGAASARRFAELQQRVNQLMQQAQSPTSQYRDELTTLRAAWEAGLVSVFQLAVLAQNAFVTAVARLRELPVEEIAAQLGRSVEQVKAVLATLGTDTADQLDDMGRNVRMIAHGVGMQIVMGIVRGIKDAEDFLRNIIISVISAAVSFGLASALGIKSPSKLGMWAGEQVTLGVAVGIEDTARSVVGRATGKLQSAIVRALDPAVALRSIDRALMDVGRMVVPAGLTLAPGHLAPAFASTAGGVADRITPAGGSFVIQADMSQAPQPVTPEAQAVNAYWQRVFTETQRAVNKRGGRG
jgi:hypothetical protein